MCTHPFSSLSALLAAPPPFFFLAEGSPIPMIFIHAFPPPRVPPSMAIKSHQRWRSPQHVPHVTLTVIPSQLHHALPEQWRGFRHSYTMHFRSNGGDSVTATVHHELSEQWRGFSHSCTMHFRSSGGDSVTAAPCTFGAMVGIPSELHHALPKWWGFLHNYITSVAKAALFTSQQWSTFDENFRYNDRGVFPPLWQAYFRFTYVASAKMRGVFRHNYDASAKMTGVFPAQLEHFRHKLRSCFRNTMLPPKIWCFRHNYEAFAAMLMLP